MPLSNLAQSDPRPIQNRDRELKAGRAACSGIVPGPFQIALATMQNFLCARGAVLSCKGRCPARRPRPSGPAGTTDEPRLKALAVAPLPWPEVSGTPVIEVELSARAGAKAIEAHLATRCRLSIQLNGTSYSVERAS